MQKKISLVRMNSLGCCLKLVGLLFGFYSLWRWEKNNLFTTVTLLCFPIFRSCCGVVINSKEWPQGNCNMLTQPPLSHTASLKILVVDFTLRRKLTIKKKMCYLETDKSFTTYVVGFFALLYHSPAYSNI